MSSPERPEEGDIPMMEAEGEGTDFLNFDNHQEEHPIEDDALEDVSEGKIDDDKAQEDVDEVNNAQEPEKLEPDAQELTDQSTAAPSNADVGALSTYLSVDTASLESINAVVLQKIQAAITQLTQLRSEKTLLEVQLESSSHLSNKKLELLKNKMSRTENENSDLKEANQTLKQSQSLLEQKILELQNASHTSSSLSETSKYKIEELEAENRQTLAMLDKKEKEIETLRSECEDLHEANSQLRKNALERENLSQTAMSNLSRAEHKIKTLESELDSVKSDAEHLRGDVKKATNEFSEYRTSKSSEISSLQAQLDKKSSDLSNIQVRFEHLTANFDEISKKYNDALTVEKKLKDELAAREEDYIKEISIKDRLVDLLKKSIEDLKDKINHLESRLNASRSGVANESATLQTQVDKYKAQLEQKEAKVRQLEQTIDELYQTGDAGNISMVSLPPLSPSAKATAAKHTGLSLSQLYADFTLIKRQLTQERRTKERMQQQMDAFVNELEQRAPVIAATKERATMLEKELTELSVILENTTREKEALQKAQSEFTSKLQESEVEITSLRKQRADLARQVQHLVVQVTIRNDNGGPLTPAEKKAIERIASGDKVVNGSDTDALISDRLVTFQNIVDLQKKNEDLLRIVRELGAKAEQQEQLSRSRLENLESTAINEAKEAIVTLQDELKSVESKLNSVTRERDMFRSLLSGKSNGNNILTAELSSVVPGDKLAELTVKYEESQKMLASVQEHLERVTSESNKTIQTLNEQINALTSEKSSVALSLAREKSSNELLAQRYAALEDNLKYTKSEVVSLRNNNEALQSNLAKQEQRSHDVSEQLMEAKSLVETLRAESSNLKNEKLIWKSIEQRLNQENASLTDEKNKLNSLLMNLQFADKERDARHAEAQKRWANHTESVEKELDATRTRLTETSSELKEVLARKEADSHSYQERVDALRTELSATREELIIKKSAVESLEHSVKSLTTKLTAAEARVNDYQSIANSSNAYSELASTTMRLKADLDDTNAELDEAKRSVEEFKAISTAAEESLNNMTAAFDEYKKSTAESAQKLESENKSLSQKVEMLTQQVDSLNNELTEQRSAASKQLEAAQKETESLRLEIEEAKKEKAHTEGKLALIETSLEQQTALANEAQENYQNALEKHVEASKAYRALREETSALKEKINEYSTAASEAKSELVKSQESWDSQKTQLDEELRIAVARVRDLDSQNKLLYSEIERLSKRTPEITPGADIEVDGASDELRQLITLLRREKEISDTQLEVAKRDLKRVTQQVEVANAELDKTRLELVKAQSRDTDVDRITEEYEKLQKDLEQLNLLRESNITLRNELQDSVKRVKVLQEQLSESQSKVLPLETQVSQLTAEITHKSQEIRLTIEERDRWKQRTQDILNKYDRIDPEEHNKLKELNQELTQKVEETTTRLDRLRGEAQEKLKKSSTNYKELRARTDEVISERDTLQKEVETLKLEKDAAVKEVESLKSTVVDLEKNVKSAHENPKKKGAFENMKKELESTKAALETANKELETTQAELVAKTKELEKVTEFENKIKELEATNASLEEKVKELEGQVKKLTDDLESGAKSREDTVVLSGASDEQASVIDGLKSELEKANIQLEAVKAEADKARSEAEVAKAEIVKVRADAEKAKTELDTRAGTPIISGMSSAEPTQDLEAALKKQEEELRAEFDAVKARLRAPSEEKLKRIAEARAKKVEEEFQVKFDDLKAEYEKMLAEKNGGADSQKLVAEYETKIAELKKEFEETKSRELEETQKKAYEEGRQATLSEVAMRTRLLQSKIDKLTKTKQELEAKLAAAATDAVTSPVPAAEKAAPEVTEKSVADAVPAEGAVPTEQGIKRQAEEDDEHQEKKSKSEGAE